jgi:predicted nucleotidyltransferase
MIEWPFDIDKLIEICRKNDIARVSVFGSMARAEATEQSDIDLLVYLSKPKSLLGMIALERQFTAALGRQVDLLTEEDISPYMRPRVKRDLQVVYETS